MKITPARVRPIHGIGMGWGWRSPGVGQLTDSLQTGRQRLAVSP